MNVRNILLASVTLSAAAPASAQQSFFGGVGDLSGGLDSSHAARLSANGQVVVGEAHDANGLQAVRYTRSGGLFKLDRLSGNMVGQGHRAEAVSADGATIVGWSTGVAVRWNAAGAVTRMNDLSGGNDQAYAYAISADGKTIGGAGTTAQGTGAVRWRSPNFGVENLGDLAGGFSYLGAVSDVSADGSVLVGNSSSTLSTSQGNFTEFREAFRYANGVMTGLGDFAGGRPNSLARVVSGDGATIAGFGTVGNDYRHAMRWTQATGMIDLGTGGGRQSEIYSISSDGLYLGGVSDFSMGADGQSAGAIWTATGGWMRVSSLFSGAGISTAGWSFGNVTGLQSMNGVLYLCGSGIHNGSVEGWYAGVNMAPVPEPTSLFALGLGAAAFFRRRARLR